VEDHNDHLEHGERRWGSSEAWYVVMRCNLASPIFIFDGFCPTWGVQVLWTGLIYQYIKFISDQYAIYLFLLLSTLSRYIREGRPKWSSPSRIHTFWPRRHAFGAVVEACGCHQSDPRIVSLLHTSMKNVESEAIVDRRILLSLGRQMLPTSRLRVLRLHVWSDGSLEETSTMIYKIHQTTLLISII
jgi:hypothetical protein